MKRKLAQCLRAVSLPAVLALLLLCLLRIQHPVYFVGNSFWISIITVVIIPLLPYPISLVQSKVGAERRETQRSIAFKLTLVGHTAALLYGWIKGLCPELMLIYWTYFLSIFVLFVFNKLLRIRASAHGAGMSGAFFLMPYLLASVWYLPCAAMIAAVCWSSVVLGRHTIRELIFGGCCGGIAFFLSMAITML